MALREAILFCAHARDLRLWKGPLPELLEPPVPHPAPPPEPPQPSAPDPPAPPETPSARVKRPRELVIVRPRTRGDCLPGGPNAARPCPFVSCRYHLAVHVDGNEIAVVTEDPSTLPQTCTLDVADVTDDSGRAVLLRDLEPYFGVTRENVRRLQMSAIRELAEGLYAVAGGEAEMERLIARVIGANG